MKRIAVAVLIMVSAHFARADEGEAFLLAAPLTLGISASNITAISGVSAGYFLRDDVFVSLDYSHDHSPFASDYGVKTKADAIGLDVGYYLTETFFVRGGPRVKSLIVSQHQYSSAPYQSGEAVRYEVKVAIGNTLSRGAFMYGIDWLAIAVPLKTTVTANPQDRDFEGKQFEVFKFWIGAKF